MGGYQPRASPREMQGGKGFPFRLVARRGRFSEESDRRHRHGDADGADGACASVNRPGRASTPRPRRDIDATEFFRPVSPDRSCSDPPPRTISASAPRRRRVPLFGVAAATSPRPVSTDYPRGTARAAAPSLFLPLALLQLSLCESRRCARWPEESTGGAAISVRVSP